VKRFSESREQYRASPLPMLAALMVALAVVAGIPSCKESSGPDLDTSVGPGGGQVIVVTDKEFQAEVLEDPGPIILFFHDPKISHSTDVEGIFGQLGAEWGVRVKFCQVNRQDGRRAAQRMGVSGYPAVMLWRDQEIANAMVGGIDEKVLRYMVKDALNQ